MPAKNLHIFVSSALLIVWDRATQATDEIVGLHKQRSSRKLSEGGFDPADIAVVPTWLQLLISTSSELAYMHLRWHLAPWKSVLRGLCRTGQMADSM